MIRRLGAPDLAVWRAFRIEALTASPESFLTTLEEEEARTDEELAADLEERPVLGRFDGDRLTGCVALRAMDGPSFAHRAWIGTVYVAPDRRGTGDADRLMEAIVAVAREARHLQLELYVLAANVRAVRRLNRITHSQQALLIKTRSTPCEPRSCTPQATSASRPSPTPG